MKNEAPYVDIERSIIKQFRKEIWRPFVRGLQEYKMIRDGDKVAVCISGGKDSMLLAKCLQQLKRQSSTEFGLEFIVMDPGYHPDNRKLIEDNAALMNIPVRIFDSDIFDIVVDVDQSPCYLCARMRRGYLYAHARELGCNKIALGHHFDDAIETILMGILYGGQMNTMMPKLHSTNFEGMELIRPLYFVKEEDILNWKDYNGLHFLPVHGAGCKGTGCQGDCGEWGGYRPHLQAPGDEGINPFPQENQSLYRCKHHEKRGEYQSGCLPWICAEGRAPSFYGQIR